MSETTTNTTSTEAADKATSVVDTIFDLGMSWAAYGLKLGKSALEQSAKTLEKTAQSLETLAKELEKKEEPAKQA